MGRHYNITVHAHTFSVLKYNNSKKEKKNIYKRIMIFYEQN